MICLRCGSRVRGKESHEMERRFDCEECGLRWWQESTLYLEGDRMPMTYVENKGDGRMVDVPGGCLAVFGEVAR